MVGDGPADDVWISLNAAPSIFKPQVTVIEGYLVPTSRMG